ncbi:YrrS family protein [Sutcliffiella halmapala]|uniref:YrrS family protein n=1 Tax=Sutcliffiella halmapala TaxID=79882 RepID=UPI0009952005|nr:YrrS family protein [Sutcliffiella halmapala]
MSLNFRDGSRYGRTTKRKKTNLILNVLIGIVFIFIIFLSSQLFFGKNTTEPAGKEVDTNEQELNDSAEQDAEEENGSTPAEEEEEASKEEEKREDEEEIDEDTEENEDGEAQVSENSDDPNVIKTITNPSWAPVGTSQSEPHVSIYDESHVDWKEKLNAITAATGLSGDAYTLYYLGNGGSEHHAIASIKDKASGESFKVYLEWVTGKGWKPLKVEQVKAL